MVSLCSNRPSLPGHPSLCTLDVAVIPLATYLFFVAQIVHICLTCRARTDSSQLPLKQRPFLLPQWAHIAYFILILAALAMVALEIGRLVISNLGVGLLPVTIVGLLLALALQSFRADRKVFRAEILLFYWTLLWIFEAIKVSRLSTLVHYYPNKTIAKYPASDQLIDNAVMIVIGFQRITVLVAASRTISHFLLLHFSLSPPSLASSSPSVALAMAASHFAIVTLLTSDSYLPGALNVAAALRDLHPAPPFLPEVPFQTLCLVTPETVDINSIRALRKAFDVVVGVEVIEEGQEEGLRLLGRPDLNLVLTKLHVFRLTQYKKILFLDADVLPIRPLSHLLTLPHSFSAVPDVGWPDIFNSGVMVLEPGEDKFKELMDLVRSHGSWDGGDQGLLNEWRGGDWNRLSFTYNTTPTAAYTYAPAYTRFGSQISAIHFIGPNKPWSNLQWRAPMAFPPPAFLPAPQPSGSAPGTPPQQSYAYEHLVDRWYATYDTHYRSAAPVEEKRRDHDFGAVRYESVWDRGASTAHLAFASRPFDLDELKQMALRGSGQYQEQQAGESVYYSLPLEGRIDLMRRPKVVRVQESERGAASHGEEGAVDRGWGEPQDQGAHGGHEQHGGHEGHSEHWEHQVHGGHEGRQEYAAHDAHGKESEPSRADTEDLNGTESTGIIERIKPVRSMEGTTPARWSQIGIGIVGGVIVSASSSSSSNNNNNNRCRPLLGVGLRRLTLILIPTLLGLAHLKVLRRTHVPVVPTVLSRSAQYPRHRKVTLTKWIPLRLNYTRLPLRPTGLPPDRVLPLIHRALTLPPLNLALLHLMLPLLERAPIQLDLAPALLSCTHFLKSIHRLPNLTLILHNLIPILLRLKLILPNIKLILNLKLILIHLIPTHPRPTPTLRVPNPGPHNHRRTILNPALTHDRTLRSHIATRLCRVKRMRTIHGRNCVILARARIIHRLHLSSSRTQPSSPAHAHIAAPSPSSARSHWQPSHAPPQGVAADSGYEPHGRRRVRSWPEATPPRSPSPPPRDLSPLRPPPSPPLVTWNPAVEPPPNTLPSGAADQPTETYFPNIWDMPPTPRHAHTHFHSGPSTHSERAQYGERHQPEAFFEIPATPAIPRRLVDEGHYAAVISNQPDRGKVSPVFPWESESKPRRTHTRVFPRSDSPPLPGPMGLEPEPEPEPEPELAPGLPAPEPIAEIPSVPYTFAIPEGTRASTGSPDIIYAPPILPPGVPLSRFYGNAWDNVPSIQKYATRLVRPSPSSAPPAPTAPEATPEVAEGGDEASSRDGDDEDEDEDSDLDRAKPSTPEHARPRSSRPGVLSPKTRSRSGSKSESRSGPKTYSSQGVQTDVKETREYGVQTDTPPSPPLPPPRPKHVSPPGSAVSPPAGSSRFGFRLPPHPRQGGQLSPLSGAVSPRMHEYGYGSSAAPNVLPSPGVGTPPLRRVFPPSPPKLSFAALAQAAPPSPATTSRFNQTPAPATAPLQPTPALTSTSLPNVDSPDLYTPMTPQFAAQQAFSRPRTSSTETDVTAVSAISPSSSVGPASPSSSRFTRGEGAPARIGRKWDPARGVEVFKRDSQEVLAKFLKMGSWEGSSEAPGASV
ncbi:glycosyltransferase family 8 protein [Botryobasidium botryosum FD-172 SS1]|uniref:glycogenin glucosyltransferase n=1 Tax=Botryobasidium botryosum (strain FD-172 SS1) TaxID=930990 RepID=A0A067MYG5_BOTB1|nr:glycosyltransferase family 8 protein [Botryobasidium botryosum FD-172 SS1]